jgi:hypothetical protein
MKYTRYRRDQVKGHIRSGVIRSGVRLFLLLLLEKTHKTPTPLANNDNKESLTPRPYFLNRLNSSMVTTTGTASTRIYSHSFRVTGSILRMVCMNGMCMLRI